MGGRSFRAEQHIFSGDLFVLLVMCCLASLCFLVNGYDNGMVTGCKVALSLKGN